MIQTEKHESQIKCPADKFFAMCKHDMLDMPETMPENYKNVQLLEGDGKTVGSVRLWTYVLADDPAKVLTGKELLEELDDENRRITFRPLEGSAVMEDYKSFAIKLSVTPTSDGDGGSLVKWVFEFEKKHDHSPHPHTYVDHFALISSHFDSLLHKATDE